jgi:hypothetical protein
MKFVFSAALIGALAQDLLTALEPVAQKHFGTTSAEVVQALATAAPAVAAAAAPTQPANEAPVTITTNGQVTAEDAALTSAVELGAEVLTATEASTEPTA